MVSIKECIKKFLLCGEFEKNLSKLTLKAYSIDLKQFLEYLDYRNINVMAEINSEVLRDYIKKLKTKYKIKSIKRKLACLKSLFEYLISEEIIIDNPFWKLKVRIKNERTLPKVLTLREIGKIFRAAYNELKKEGLSEAHYKSVIRDIAILELLFATGLRVSEISNLTEEDIDLNVGKIEVLGKGKKERIIYIQNFEVVKAMKVYKKTFSREIKKCGFFFINRLGKKYSDQSIRFMVKKYSSNAKITRKITPHIFRHSFATLLLEQGVDIRYLQSFLGHSSISTTEIYTHVNSSIQKKILKQKHPRNNISFE